MDFLLPLATLKPSISGELPITGCNAEKVIPYGRPVCTLRYKKSRNQAKEKVLQVLSNRDEQFELENGFCCCFVVVNIEYVMSCIM